jgi:dipeptidyl aminopeptidase/acylaminoacyl peptidase
MLFLVWVICAIAPSSLRASREENRSGVTVQDSIEMTRLADHAYNNGWPSKGRVAQFSPDGKRFAIVLKKGNLKQNTTDYFLYIFDTTAVFNAPNPTPALEVSSSSNREGIRDVRWLNDSETLAFLGERPGESAQVYSFNIRTKHLEKLTNHSTHIVSYEISRDGKTLVFEADPGGKAVSSEQPDRHGIVILDQSLAEILAGDCGTFVPTRRDGERLFVQKEKQPEKEVAVEDMIAPDWTFSLSPTGRYALVRVWVRKIPRAWVGYANRDIHERALEKLRPGTSSALDRYMLLDTVQGTFRPLIDAPAYFSDEFSWAPDETSIVLSGALLPLDVKDPVEREARTKTKYVVEVGLPNGQLTKISAKDYKAEAWERKTNLLVLQPNESSENLTRVGYRKESAGWTQVPLSAGETSHESPLDVTLEEKASTPPKIFVTDARSKRRSLLLDLNPQFSKIRMGKIETVNWKATDGREMEGGLYLPPDYDAARKYPLVIQTHGYDPGRFTLDGAFPSAMAAEPLAAKGVIVLQIGGMKDAAAQAKFDEATSSTPQEPIGEMSAYEGAIDFLANKGMIDRENVGIIGFSRTAYEVAYTLTHSKYRFRAATLADGMTGSYFSYIVSPDQDYEALNGGKPFGEGLSLWLKNAPGFNLEKIEASVRIEAYGARSVLGSWEWYTGLQRLEKPVDYVYLPGAAHVLARPLDRMASQQGNVDWFCFWLKNEEDPDPAKAEQYRRWRELRKLQ